MVVDVRANLVCGLGQVISGDLSDDLLQDAGIMRTTGTLVLKGIVKTFRGMRVQLAYERPHVGTVTRFPRMLRVLRATSDPYRQSTTLEVGCKLALMENLKIQDSFVVSQLPANQANWPNWYVNLSPTDRAKVWPTIDSQKLMLYCINRVGITLAPGSVPLTFQFMRYSQDLSGGYVATLSDLLKSHCCYAYMNLQEQLVVKKFNLTAISSAPALIDDDLVDLQQTTGGEDPADQISVTFNALMGP